MKAVAKCILYAACSVVAWPFVAVAIIIAATALLVSWPAIGVFAFVEGGGESDGR